MEKVEDILPTKSPEHNNSLEYIKSLESEEDIKNNRFIHKKVPEFYTRDNKKTTLFP